MAKRFVICERESNGEFARMSEYATRAEAIHVLANIFRNDVKADPQNFKVVEEEYEADMDEFEALVANMLDKISHLGKFSVVFGTIDEKPYPKKSATVRMLETFPVWTGTVIEKVFRCLGDKANFSISTYPLNNQSEMLIVENKG